MKNIFPFEEVTLVPGTEYDITCYPRNGLYYDHSTLALYFVFGSAVAFVSYLSIVAVRDLMEANREAPHVTDPGSPSNDVPKQPAFDSDQVIMGGETLMRLMRFARGEETHASTTDKIRASLAPEDWN